MIEYALSVGDAEELAKYFLAKMSMKQRRDLMAERPLLYARILPGVDPEAIVRNVTAGLAATARQHATDAVAIVSGQYLTETGAALAAGTET